MCIAVIGVTYSFFSASDINENSITGVVASTSLELSINKIAPSNDGLLIPQLQNAIQSAIVGINGNCVDGNNNNVCQVYKVEVKNTGNYFVNIMAYLDFKNKNIPNLRWALIDNFEEGMKTKPLLTTQIYSYKYNLFSGHDTLDVGESKVYYLVIFIKETGRIQNDSGNFNGTISFEINNSNAIRKINDLRLNNSLKNFTPDVNKTNCSDSSCEENLSGIYNMRDNLGISYYFRGDVENNYVKFGEYKEDAYAIYNPTEKISTYSNLCPADSECVKIASKGDPMYWRIVRINGDGTIRMIYDGTAPYRNGDISNGEKRHMGYSAFNKNYDDNKYAGYMYGNSSDSYTNAHSNINDSSIKTTLDGWYRKYIAGSSYEQYIADAIYCNDRKLWSGNGYGKYQTLYDSYLRVTYVIPILFCQRVEDSFTLKNGIIDGNKKLDYPIGMLTIYEYMLAGAHPKKDNSKMYLISGTYYNTMTPELFNSKNGIIVGYSVDDNGNGGVGDGSLSIKHSVRGVISLKSDVIFSGTGTFSDPFIVIE